MARLVLLGCPGAGKGTQSKVLAQRYALTHIATGDIFRAEIASKTPLGLRVADYLKSGTLVPDSLVIEMVAGRLERGADGFILDGYPRTLEQAQALDQYLNRTGKKLDMVLHLNLDETEVLRRLTRRRSCSGCGALYNLESRVPKEEGKCDECGGALTQREDDREETVRKRLMVYEDLTRPLIAYYRTEHAFHEIDASQGVDRVTQQLTVLIDGAAVST
ncbi:MAG: adenylate kinase [Elusimicrobia bacterium]|nr:adenylate kinase [Elusimicrobiota bacterium]